MKRIFTAGCFMTLIMGALTLLFFCCFALMPSFRSRLCFEQTVIISLTSELPTLAFFEIIFGCIGLRRAAADRSFIGGAILLILFSVKPVLWGFFRTCAALSNGWQCTYVLFLLLHMIAVSFYVVKIFDSFQNQKAGQLH